MTNNQIVLSEGESLLWSGKPKKNAFITKRTITMMPIAIVWLLFDSTFIMAAFQDGESTLFMIPFFALHLMPVWIWIGNMITASRRWKNTMYYVTNRRMVIQSGYWAVNEVSLFYKEVEHAQVHIGLVSKLFQTGSIWFNGDYRKNGFVFEELENPNEAYRKIQKIILDIQTDMEYPNALRPEINEGYNTEYRP